MSRARFEPSTSRIQVRLIAAWAIFLDITDEEGEKFRTFYNEEICDLFSHPILLDNETYEATADWRVARMNIKNAYTYRVVMEQFWKMSNCKREGKRWNKLHNDVIINFMNTLL